MTWQADRVRAAMADEVQWLARLCERCHAEKGDPARLEIAAILLRQREYTGRKAELTHRLAELVEQVEADDRRAQAPDLLHPYGRCSCGGEGRCDWCRLPCGACGLPRWGVGSCDCPEGPAPPDDGEHAEIEEAA